MHSLTVAESHFPAMDDRAIEKARKIEQAAIQLPQESIATSHLIHAGMYARTIMIPAGTMITGALIKIPTIIIIQGDVVVYIGTAAEKETMYFHGYNIVPASANRKQVFLAKTDTYLTMIFTSEAETIQDAEEEFTDEANMLISRCNTVGNHILVTGQ